MEEGYRVKRIKFHGQSVGILMQSDNGPCPLLALANSLLLKEQIDFHEDYSFISHEVLIQEVGNYLFNDAHNLAHPSSLQNEVDPEQLNRVISTLPRLNRGLDVNIRFTDIFEFESSSEVEIFRMLNIPLVHGWVVPEGEVREIIGCKTYNQLQDKMAALQAIKSQQAIPESQAKKLQKYVKIKQFLDDSASQLTRVGLERLHTNLEEKTLAVLFRNNHFSTIYKYKGCIYSLATDIGFLREDRVVWEKLNEIAGNTSYCNSTFVKTMTSDPKTPDKLVIVQEEASILFDDYGPEEDYTSADKLRKEQEDASLALAIAMQEKFEYEEAKAAADAADARLRQIGAAQPGQPHEHGLPSAPPHEPTQMTHESESAPQPKKKKKKCLVF